METLSILMLQEAKCTSLSLEAIIKKVWKGSKGEAMDAHGAPRGLALL